jgi:putative iron-regulated protein
MGSATLAARAAEIDADAVARHYATLVHATYVDTLTAAEAMRARIREFLAEPGRQRLAAARRAWLDAREWYGQTEAFRFYGGPIDDARGPESRLNTWPVDESYIDSVRDRPEAGLVNDPSVSITKAALSSLNQAGGEENICTGWHAVEFMLWGQDFNDDGPGDRPFEDFVDGKAPNAARRRLYLDVVTDLLIDDLRYLVEAWRPDAANYRATFLQDPHEAVRLMLIGLGSLSRGELAGERLEVPLATQDQEDEQSCFSDNTHRDVVADIVGIRNVWWGRYLASDGRAIEGPSLRALVAARSADLATATSADLDATLALAEALHPPFDQEIRGGDEAPGRRRVRAVIDALKRQTADLTASAEALGITRLSIGGGKRR